MELPQVACQCTHDGCGLRIDGRTNMNVIVARILLFLAYASIMVGTTGWFGNAHLVLR
jgi:hypothetical protein